MKKTIDLTYQDISDDGKGKHLGGHSTQTVQKAIKALEEHYFEGKNVFRKGDANSDYLFRWEIVDLLKLLIILQVSDGFSSKKAAKAGVSAISIKKIMDGYQYLSECDTMKDYERIVLEASVQAQKSKETLHYLQRAQQSISRYILLSSICYDLYPFDVFKNLTQQFDDLTWHLNRNIHFEVLAQNMRVSQAKVTRHGNIYARGIAPIALNLKNTVVVAVNRIADEIYDYDEEGICSRKIKISNNDETQNRYEEICAKHLDFLSSGVIEMSEEEIYSSGGIEEIRREIDAFMSDYFRAKYPNQATDDDDAEDDDVNLLRKPLKDYIGAFCWMNLFCSRKITREQWKCQWTPEQCFNIVLKSKTYLNDYNHSEFKFAKYLSALEESVRKQFTTLESVCSKDKMDELVDQKVDEYLEDVKAYKKNKEQRMSDLDQLIGNQKDVGDNVENIKANSAALLKNMLAIILKFEEEDNVQEMVEQYYDECTRVDSAAYEDD